MKRIFWSAFVAGIFTVVIYFVNQLPSTDHQNVTYNVGKVVSLGQCRDGTCSFGYTDNNGQLKYATTDKPVSIDQLVYQECWYEEAKGNRCYVDYEPSKN